MQGMLDDAIMTYKEAIAREPNFPEAYNNLVSAYVVPCARHQPASIQAVRV